jgi:hypothetical protein
MGLADDYMAKVLAAKGTQGGSIIRPGKYTFQIVRLAFEKKFKSDYLVCEFLVLSAATAGPVYNGKDVPPLEHVPNAVGTTCSNLIDLRSESGAGNLKALGCALAGIDERTADPKIFLPGGEFDDFVRDFSNEDPTAKKANGQPRPVQPLKGFLIKTETYTKPIKSGANAGKPFTGHNWKNVSPTEGNDAKSVTDRNAAAAAAK